MKIMVNGKISITQYAVAIGMLLITACGGKPDQGKLIQEGKALMDKQDCKTCHHPVNKGIGPAHTLVAEKYEFTNANVTLLAQRIIQGSSGVWGDMPMNPHPDLSQEDAEKIVRYILSLDGEQPQ